MEKAAEKVWREGREMAVKRNESEEKVGVPREETVVVLPEEPVEPTEEENPMAGE